MKPAVECVSRPSRPRDDLPSSLAGMQDERLVGADLDLAGEVGLVGRRIDVRVLVVVEDPEELVEPNVDAGRLDHVARQRIEFDAPAVQFGQDVAIGEKHRENLVESVEPTGVESR